MTYAIFEQLALAIVFVVSAIHALKVVAPAAFVAWKKRLLIAALQPSRPAFVRNLARRFAPVPVRWAKPNACGPCNGCEKGRTP